MRNTSIHRQSRISGASLHRTGRVNVPLRNSWFLRIFSLTTGEECLRSVPDEAFRGLPLGISQKRHDFGGGGWCEIVDTAHSVQDWGNLGRGDKVLVQVGDDEWQLKVLIKPPFYFEHFVGPCRDQLLEAHWIASVRSISRSELSDWLHSMNFDLFNSPVVSPKVNANAG